MTFGGMPLFWLMTGTFLAGVLVMGWIKSFQISVILGERDAAREEAALARRDRDRTIGAANVVVESERKINHAGKLPGGGFGLLLDDAKRAPTSPGGTPGRLDPGVKP